MSKTIIITVAISVFFISCTKEAELITRQYPMVLTRDVTNVQSEGVTLNGEFKNVGYSNVTEYGFVFSTFDPDLENSSSLIISPEAKNGLFSGSIEQGIAGNIKYHVRAFAKTEKQIIYGNRVEFFSQGSKFNPWDLILQADISGWHDAFSSSSNELGFIIFQSGDFYSYNPENNSVIKRQSIPMSGNTGTHYASFYLNSYLYVLSNNSFEILRYDIDKDQWTKMGNRPFSPERHTGFFGLSINNMGYFLSRDNIFSYNKTNDTWTQMRDISLPMIYSAEVVNDRLYVFADNKGIWSYTPEINSWRMETTYPGIWNNNIVSFTQNDKIYYGLSYYGSYSGAPSPATDFWEYNPELKTWKEIENFPIYHSQNELFKFSIGSLSYFGYRQDYRKYHLFKFDSQKIK
jgi:hypothetical protein